MRKRTFPVFSYTWRHPDGTPLVCEEKIRLLNENLSEISEYCQDAFEDAILMGCDEEQIRHIFLEMLENLKNPYKKPQKEDR